MPRVHTKPTISLLKGRKRPYRVTYYDFGRRRTKHFLSRPAAVAFAGEHSREVQSQGDLALTMEERVLLHRLRTTSGGSDLSAQLQELLDDLRRRPAGQDVPTLAEAVEEFLTDCLARNLRPHTRQHYERMLGYFARGREAVRVSAVDGEMVTSWISGRYANAESRKTARTPLVRFFRWCRERGYRTDALEIRLQLPMSDERRVEFLAAVQVRAFFANLNPNYWAACALGFFTGIRPIELQRLEWRHVNVSTRAIDIPGEVAKTRRFRRLHDLPENLWKWLAAAPVKTGPIVPGNYRNYRAAIKDARQGAAWPHDAMRHSFGSYGYHRGLEWCIDTMGHVSGYKTFVKHYKGAASRAESDSFFSIMPPRKSAASILKERRPRPKRARPLPNSR